MPMLKNIVGLAFPPFVERKIDGSLVGLSKNLSLDVFTPYSVIMDFKTGVERYEHRLAVTGYALALEADNETDVNFGFVVYIRFGKSIHFVQKEFTVSDELGREFLEIRDEIAEIWRFKCNVNFFDLLFQIGCSLYTWCS